MFVIGCKFDPANPVIFKCIATLRYHNPSAEIVVVDSDSKDKTYFKEMERYKVKICDINNHNYTSGMIWYIYQKYKRQFYYFLHDSIEVSADLEDISMIYDVASLRYFPGWRGVGNLPHHCGFDTQPQLDWAEKEFNNKCGFSIPDRFTGLFGPMLFCNRRALDLLKDNNFDRILPETKEQSQGTERLWGIALSYLGYDIVTNSIQGNHWGTLDESRIKKIFVGRN